MDFNDITIRLKRLYNLIDKQYEYDVPSNTKRMFERSGNRVSVGVVFGHYDETELVNRVFSAISAIGSLKDLLKKKLQDLNKNPQDVEDMIESSLESKLIMDLWNQDKHGYPLNKYARSRKNPKIVNIQQGLSIANRSNQATFTFSINADRDTIGDISSENSVISINGDVIDENGVLIMRVDQMIETSVRDFENFIHNHGLV